MSAPGPRRAQKGELGPGERSQRTLAEPRQKHCSSLGLTLKAGMLSNESKRGERGEEGGEEEKWGERRERGRERGRKGGLKRRNESGGGYVPHSVKKKKKTLLVLIYTCMTTAQNELHVRRGQQQQNQKQEIGRKN